jgi:hypothetical protein
MAARRPTHSSLETTMTIAKQLDHCTRIVKEVLRSPGTPLDPAVRALMETRFGREFGRVRMHTDEVAAASAWALGASAYTVGTHIVFGKGRYHPGTRFGLWLLAHELAHVVQQGGEGSLPPLGPTGAGNALEREADQTADSVTAGRSLPQDFVFRAAPVGAIQRHPGTPCGGIPAVTDELADQLIGEALTNAYLDLPNVQEAAVFRGYNWYNYQAPAGAPNQAFANLLLHLIDDNFPRDDPNVPRPDIIDFQRRQAYWFVGGSGGPHRLEPFVSRFGSMIEKSRRGTREQVWYAYNSNWFPDHELPLIGDPLQRFLCTQATDHVPPIGVIYFDVRRREKKEKKKQPVSYSELTDMDADLWDLRPMLKASLTDCCGTNATLGYNWSGRFVPSIKEASSSGCLRA